MIRRLISHIAFRYNRICYQAGYNDGYGQGHFDGFADTIFGEGDFGEPSDPPIEAGFDADDHIPF
jgi:hypothetical protein